MAENERLDAQDEGWSFADVLKPEPVSYFWEPWIGFRGLTLLAGDSEAGKSCLVSRLVAFATGAPGPDGRKVHNGAALMLVGEEDIAGAVRERLVAAGADLSRVIMRGPGGPDPVRMPGSLSRLTGIVVRAGIKLVVVDPITSYAARGYSLNDEQQTRDVLDTLVELAVTTGCAAMVVRNLRKGQDDPVERIIGSVAFKNVPRSIILAVPHPVRSGMCLVHAKNSIGEKAPSLNYVLCQKEGKVPVWRSNGKAGITLEQLGPEAHDPGVRDECEAAEAFIRHYVREDWVRSTEVYAAGEKEYLSERTIRRAARQLGVDIRRTGNGTEHRSEWRMPKEGYPE